MATTDTIRKPAKIPKRHQKIGWESLPRDLLLKIYERLRIEDLLVGAPLACGHWYRTSLDRGLYKDVDLQRWSAICRRIGKLVDVLDLLKIVVQRSGAEIERVWFPQFYLEDSHLIFLAYTCPNLKFFYVRSLELISEQAFRYAITKWKELESMVVDEHLLTPKILESVRSCCKNFSSLSIVGPLSESTASSIVHYLPKLKSINMTYSNFWDHNLVNILRSCEKLESLEAIHWDRLGLDVDEFQKILPGFGYLQFYTQSTTNCDN